MPLSNGLFEWTRELICCGGSGSGGDGIRGCCGVVCDSKIWLLLSGFDCIGGCAIVGDFTNNSDGPRSVSTAKLFHYYSSFVIYNTFHFVHEILLGSLSNNSSLRFGKNCDTRFHVSSHNGECVTPSLL